MTRKLTTAEVEFAVAEFLNYRSSIIVPNVFWGMGLNYEADLWVVSPVLHVTEIEIKISNSDIAAEKKKAKWVHKNKHVRRFFYAVPDYLADCKWLDEEVGLITVDENLRCKIIRKAKINKDAIKLPEKQKNHLLHLGCMRMWRLKKKLINCNVNSRKMEG